MPKPKNKAKLPLKEKNLRFQRKVRNVGYRINFSPYQTLFGDTVASIIAEVTNLEDNLRKINWDDQENLQRLMHTEDERVALVKLSDRLHNMRTIQFHASLDKQRHKANGTLAFFAPLAKQLGRLTLAKELEELSLQVLNQTLEKETTKEEHFGKL